MSALNHLLTAISDHGNALLNKLLYSYGYLSISAGAILATANQTLDRISEPATWGIQDYAAVVAMVGGVTLIIKNLVDLYFTIINKGKK